MIGLPNVAGILSIISVTKQMPILLSHELWIEDDSLQHIEGKETLKFLAFNPGPESMAVAFAEYLHWKNITDTAVVLYRSLSVNQKFIHEFSTKAASAYNMTIVAYPFDMKIP